MKFLGSTRLTDFRWITLGFLGRLGVDWRINMYGAREVFVTGALLSLSAVLGCTHSELKRNALDMSSTLYDLQRQQVLDNIAMFKEGPDALPALVRIKSGTVQV